MLFLVRNLVASIFTTSSTASVVAICLDAISLKISDSVSIRPLTNSSNCSFDKKIYSPTSFVRRYSESLKWSNRNGSILYCSTSYLFLVIGLNASSTIKSRICPNCLLVSKRSCWSIRLVQNSFGVLASTLEPSFVSNVTITMFGFSESFS